MLRIQTSIVWLWHPPSSLASLGTSNNQTTTLSMMLWTKESAGQQLRAEFPPFQNFDFYMIDYSSPASKKTSRRQESWAVGWVCIISQSLDTWCQKCLAFKYDKKCPQLKDNWQIGLHRILFIDKGWHRPSMASMPPYGHPASQYACLISPRIREFQHSC